ncbi:hypothetical protein AB0G04_32305 [Actinoplanes sp. NPDC023801]|uniref:hypothetical protein n=1 Tax=Actinoplanes sp. NPDC023801 TaxID=3154595 RepID=UPI00340F6DA4
MPIHWFSDRSVRIRVHVAVAVGAVGALAVGMQSLLLRDADQRMATVTGGRVTTAEAADAGARQP